MVQRERIRYPKIRDEKTSPLFLMAKLKMKKNRIIRRKITFPINIEYGFWYNPP
jgi:hypothetical protein